VVVVVVVELVTVVVLVAVVVVVVVVPVVTVVVVRVCVVLEVVTRLNPVGQAPVLSSSVQKPNVESMHGPMDPYLQCTLAVTAGASVTCSLPPLPLPSGASVGNDPSTLHSKNWAGHSPLSVFPAHTCKAGW